LIFLQWQQLCSNVGISVGGLKLMPRISTSNDDTKNNIAYALSCSLSVHFGIGWAHALIGTPSGSGIAWFLVRYKAQLGLRQSSLCPFSSPSIQMEIRSLI
jgi:hypothetical protein